MRDNIFKRKIKSKMVCPLHNIGETDYLHHHTMSSSGGQRTNLVRDSAPVTCRTFRKTGNLSWPTHFSRQSQLQRQYCSFEDPSENSRTRLLGQAMRTTRPKKIRKNATLQSHKRKNNTSSTPKALSSGVAQHQQNLKIQNNTDLVHTFLTACTFGT